MKPPHHSVILTKPIYLGVTEVTQAEYEKVMGANPSYFAPQGLGKAAAAGIDTSRHPVELVTWNDAAEFCAKLSKREKLKPFYSRAGEKITQLRVRDIASQRKRNGNSRAEQERPRGFGLATMIKS